MSGNTRRQEIWVGFLESCDGTVDAGLLGRRDNDDGAILEGVLGDAEAYA